MYQKVLVVEDLNSVGYGISMMLRQELGVSEVVLTHYCDEAYLKFQNALQHNVPFDLLITDLSFKRDHRPSQLGSGKDLIDKMIQRGFDVPIIICSVEEKATMIKRFTQMDNVKAYVLKGRDGLRELKKAVKEVAQGNTFFSQKIMNLTKGGTTFEIEDYDPYPNIPAPVAV